MKINYKMLLLAFLICLPITSLLAKNNKVLMLIPKHYGTNHYLNVETLQSFGWEVITAGLTKSVKPCPYAGIPNLTVNTLITEINSITDFDCIYLNQMNWRSTGNTDDAYADFLASAEVISLLKEANSAQKIIYATCAGVRVLAKADIISGRNITGRDQWEQEYLDAGANYLGNGIAPVIDGNIVTSTRGQYYFVQANEAIKSALEKMINNKTK